MNHELDIYGLFITPLLAWAVIAWLISIPLRRLLEAIGFYRLVWHRALFDVALFFILLGGVWYAALQWT